MMQVNEKQQELGAAKANEEAEGAQMKEKKKEMDRQMRLNENEIVAQQSSLQKVQVPVFAAPRWR